MVSVLLLVQVLAVPPTQQFTIALHNRLDHFEESEFFPFAVGEELAVELNELEKYAFYECFCLLAASFLIEQGDKAVEDKPSGHKIVTEVDELQHAPCV